jgi:transcriptional regulator with XRE-family HTH domain
LRKIPERIREKIFRQWLMGDSYDRIARDSNVSKSTIHDIKEEIKKRWPDIEGLRKLSTSMSKVNISFYDAARGAKLIEDLNIAGVSLDQLKHYIKLMEKMLSGKQTEREKIVESATKLVALEEATGRECTELVEDFETKSSEIIELEAKKKEFGRPHN